VSEALSPAELKQQHFDALANVIKEFNQVDLIPNLMPEDRLTMSKIILKFNRWHKPRLDLINEAVESACNSSLYTTNLARTAAIFDTYVAIGSDTMIDAESTWNNMNGDLHGLRFHGLSLEGGNPTCE